MPGIVRILNKYKKECKTFVYLVLNDTFWYFLNDFIFHHIDASIPLSRMSTQGAKASVSRKMILKIMSKHPEDFIQFKTDHNGDVADHLRKRG